MNSSNINIPEDEVQLVAKGRKFTLPSLEQGDSIKKAIIADLSLELRSDSRLNSDTFKELINSLSSKLMVPSKINRTFISLRKRLKQHNLIIIKTDTGEALIIHDRDGYEKKILDLLAQSGVKPQRYQFTKRSVQSWTTKSR